MPTDPTALEVVVARVRRRACVLERRDAPRAAADLRTLLTALADAQAQATALREDKARLDWLDAQRRTEHPDWGYRNGCNVWSVSSESRDTLSMDGAVQDIRAALDAARTQGEG